MQLEPSNYMLWGWSTEEPASIPAQKWGWEPVVHSISHLLIACELLLPFLPTFLFPPSFYHSLSPFLPVIQ